MHSLGRRSKAGWTAIGVTIQTKDRLIAMKKAFEEKLGLGPQTWEFFLNALLDLGPLTWNFLINETVKGIQASMEPCPFPSSQPAKSRGKESSQSSK